MPPKKKPDTAGYQKLKKDLADQRPGQLYILHGEETYLRDYYLGRLREQLLTGGMGTFNFHQIEPKDMSPHALEEAIDCLPMMGERTMVQVTDFDLFKCGEKDREGYIKLFSQLPDYVCVVFVYDLIDYKGDARTKLAAAIKEHGTVANFVRQDQGDLVDWVRRRFRALGKDIDSRLALDMIFLCGDLMTNLIGEIEKVGAYARQKHITMGDIQAVATHQLDAVVFRMTDAIVHVVRCFDDENVIHVEGSTDPIRDMDTIDLELVMADLEMVERRIDKAKKAAKGDKKFLQEAADFEGLRDWLNDGKSARTYEAVDIAEEYPDCELLSLKPVIYAANLDEDGFADPHGVEYYRQVEERAQAQGAQVIPVCAKLEAEIAELDPEEKKMFLDDLGIAESGLDRLGKASYSLLGLISYLTSGEDECRAWTIKRGTKAPQAAGKIHSDFERGFIRAEVVSYDDLMACGTMAAAREKGLIRSEGKEYVVQDGDIILFRFNV